MTQRLSEKFNNGFSDGTEVSSTRVAQPMLHHGAPGEESFVSDVAYWPAGDLDEAASGLICAVVKPRSGHAGQILRPSLDVLEKYYRGFAARRPFTDRSRMDRGVRSTDLSDNQPGSIQPCCG